MSPLETSLGVEHPDSKYQRRQAAERKRKIAQQQREKRKRNKVKK
jgi:hypothetical protein